MENKFYTPELEDLFIGYELEWKTQKVSFQSFPGNEHIYNWNKHILTLKDFSEYDLATEFHNLTYNLNEFRTQYLTKEQIENEGFKYRVDFSEDFQTYIYKDVYEIGEAFIIYNFKTFILRIDVNKGNYDNSGTPTGSTVFEGKVKSINEFRKVIKMVMQ